jgi:hypothetical protein
LPNPDRANIGRPLFFELDQLGEFLGQEYDGGYMFRIGQVAYTLTILVLTLSALAQENASSGRWTATLTKGDRTGTATLNMSISGTGVTGTLSDPSGQLWQIENGKLEGNQLTFDVTAREHGGTKNIHFFGQVADGLITLHNESHSKPGQTMSFHRTKN